MIRVLAICGNGMGTSLVIKMKVKKFLDGHNINAKMESCSLGESSGYLNQGCEIALCSKHLAGDIKPKAGTHVIALKNLMDEKEFGPQILEILKNNFPGELP